MTKVRKKIGTIPINDIEQQVQQSTSAAITQMKQDVSDFIDEETAQYPEIGGTFKYQEDSEGRTEVITDSDDKILSYRDSEGVVHENIGIDAKQVTADSMIIPDDGLEQSYQYNNNHITEKNWYLPKFGKVNIKSETFYLTADSRWSSKDDVVCIQMLDDTKENAAQRLTLSYYYIKSTLTPIAGGGYDKTSVNNNSVKLDLFAGKEIGQTFGIGSDNKTYFTDEVTKVNDVYYVTSSLVDGEVVPESIVVTESQTKIYYVKKLKQVDGVWYLNSTLEGGAMQQVDYKNETVNGKAMISVLPVTDVPPYKAWCVNKKPEHYCIADIDFGAFYKKNNVPISIKYQGSGTTALRKKGLRITFYKKNDYKKKDKVKIGEMLRLSGFNMKSFATDPSRVKDPILSNIFIEMYESKGEDSYPWNKNSVPYNGATGLIESFPIETWWGNEFYGLQFFGLKKDEKNYMLDGDDDTSGIFVSGFPNGPHVWENASHYDWEDEMMDEMSQSTADALDELFKYTKGFVNGEIEIDGETVPFEDSMLEERIDLKTWIDYWICIQLFFMWDSTYRNIILYSGRDKKKFYTFLYDVDNSIPVGMIPFNSNFIEAVTDPEHPASGTVLDMSFWSKFSDEYKDSIFNRYLALRKSVLAIKNIKGIYEAYIKDIPERVIQMEQERWSTDDGPNKFVSMIEWLDKRMNFLDNNFF